MFTPLRFITIILFFFLLIIVAPGVAQIHLSLPETKAQVVPNTVIFKFKPDYQSYTMAERRRQFQELIAAIGPKVYKQKFPRTTMSPSLKPGAVDLTLLYELKYEAPHTFEKIKQQLLASGLIAYVEPVYIPQLLHQPNDPFADSTRTEQYHLKQIQAYKGWDIQKGDSSIVIGILDSGIRLTHEDLKDKIKYNYADPIDGIDNDRDGYTDNFYGWDMADDDNDPTDKIGHGSLVSGVAAGATNNGKGIAGVGYNSKIMPLKVFGDATFGGYEAIVYAADHGCQVINISWGSAGIWSEYEQDIINYAAINKDVVIVAAAGNTVTDPDYYPASYDNVLSVAILDGQDQVPSYATIGHPVDIAAPGILLQSTRTFSDNSYQLATGSSFSSPLVAGCAALVRKQFPQYNALQVAEQLRMTADDISQIPANANKTEKFGRGRVNLFRALTQTDVISVRYIDHILNTGKLVYAGDTVELTATFKNWLAPVSNLQINLTSSSPYITILQNNFTVGNMATLASATNGGLPFKIVISPDIPENEVVEFRYGFTGNNYHDYQYFTIIANPDYVTININDLHITVTSKGNLGHNGLDYKRGEGISYRNSSSLTAESGFMIGTAPDRVSGNIQNERGYSDMDIVKIKAVQRESPPKYGDKSASGVFKDDFPNASAVGVQVSHRAYAWRDAPDNKYVILEYKITNISTAPLINAYAGLFNDWDIGIYSRNVAKWDPVQNMGYAYSAERPDIFAGMKLLTPLAPTHYAIDNFNGLQQDINLGDGFTNQEKYLALSNPITRNAEVGTTGSGQDVSDVVGGKLPDLRPGESYLVAFAVLAGDNLEDLQASAAAASQKYKKQKTGPLPQVKNATVCAGSQVEMKPTGGSSYHFYADAAGHQLVGKGTSFTSPALSENTTYYVSNADSLFESSLVPLTITTATVTADFTFGANPAMLNADKEVQFFDNTLNSSQWKWYRGDQLVSTAKNPFIRFTATGSHRVSLVVVNSAGCSDSLTKAIDILAPLPVVQSASICSGTQYRVSPTGGDTFNFYADAAGTQPLATGASYLTPVLQQTTTYYISNHDFAKESTLVPVTITVEKVATAFTYRIKPITPAATGEVMFTDETPGATKWQWSFGNSAKSQEKNPVVRYTAAGVYPVTLIATNSVGCVDSTTQTIEVKHQTYRQTWQPEDLRLNGNPTPENYIYLLIAEDIAIDPGLQLEIMNALGAVVKRSTVTQSGKIRLSLTGLANGSYFLRISNANNTVTKKFIIMQE